MSTNVGILFVSEEHTYKTFEIFITYYNRHIYKTDYGFMIYKITFIVASWYNYF